jgi:hypothetical protein
MLLINQGTKSPPYGLPSPHPFWNLLRLGFCALPWSSQTIILSPKPVTLVHISAYHMDRLNIVIYTRFSSNKFIFKRKVCHSYK